MNNEIIKNRLLYAWDYIESYLNTRFKKILFFSSVILSILAAAYIVAMFDVGIVNLTFNPVKMMRAYKEPGKNYPWGVFLTFTICILLVAAMMLWKKGTPAGGRNFELSKSDVYGSAREISQRELRNVTDVTSKDATLGAILCQLDSTGKQVVASKAGAMPNDNMLVFGPPGCGKSTSYVLPYIMQAIMRRHSVIVSDTKGEVYAKTAEAARYNGYQVLRLDLKDPAHSDGWNVLKELRHDDMRALIFAQTIMANSGNPKDTFYGPQESLLRACCMYQERMPDIEDSQRTFYNAFALLLQGAETLDQTMTTACSGYPEEMQVVMDAYATFLQGSANLRGNIITGLANRLSVLASPPVREMTSTDEIDFASIGKRPTILYISMSDQHQTMSFLASLAFSFAFLDLVELADSRHTQTLEVPVHFLMEEFGNLGRVPNIDKYLSTARSRLISINLVVQSLGQLIGIYEESMTNTILADCAVWMCLGCNDKATAELLEWRSGEATVKVKTEQHSAVEPAFKFAHQHSTGDGRRAFYNSNDIMKIKARKEAFIVWQQLDSLKARAFPIFQHREFIDGHMPIISAQSLIPLSNPKAKAQFREWENQRVHSFDTWLANGGNPLRDYEGFAPKVKGKANKESRPDITPIHVLENMALAYSRGEQYDPKKDPYNPNYEGPAQPNDVENSNSEETLWEFSDTAFEMIAERADVTADIPHKPASQANTPATQPTATDPEDLAESTDPIYTPAVKTVSATQKVGTEQSPSFAGANATAERTTSAPAVQDYPDAITNVAASETAGSTRRKQSQQFDDMISGKSSRMRTNNGRPATALENKSGHKKLSDEL